MKELLKVNLVTIGHVDHGKSTLIGRLLYDAGAIKPDRLQEIEKTLRELKREKFDFAFVMDTFQEEREGGLTIDIMHTPFQSKKYSYTIIDCPGHKEFIKNMITGASQADIAILLVSAKEGEGIQSQTKEHSWLAKILGIKNMVVAINKMDAVNYEQKRFDEVAKDVKEMLESLGFETKKISFIPVSALEGDNVFRRSNKMPWYKGQTLIETLDGVAIKSELPIDKPLRLPVQDIYEIEGIGKLLIGRVECGSLRVGDEVVFQPSNIRGEVEGLELLDKTQSIARPGNNIGFKIKGISDGVKRGDVCGPLECPPKVSKRLAAQIYVMDEYSSIKPGYRALIRCGTAEIPCSAEEIFSKIDPRTGSVIEENPDSIEYGYAGNVEIALDKSIAVEKQSEIPQLGRFLIREAGITVAAGIVLDLKTI